ncbi:FG-GAP repeat protein [Halomicroarcula sp. GCM10025894]|uniref:FG-GAP repeat protein n=1 Tax=Halomicroarcula sp. GCM10025894 TaxID=3252673 RepID=UPI003620C3D1
MQRRRRYLAALAAGATGLVAGCRGGDSDSEQTATPTPTSGSTGEEPWQQTTRLSPAADEADGFDRYGSALALDSDGTTALVGAPGDGTSDHLEIGAAYVFVREDGDWTRQTELTAPDRRGDERFGCSVALSADGTTALVGANGRPVNGVTSAGAAYVFSAAGRAWTRETELTAPDGEFQDHFGSSVALSADGTTALVGAPDVDGPDERQVGSAHVFTASDGDWTAETTLTGDMGPYAKFGTAVALSDDGATALVGAKAPPFLGRTRPGRPTCSPPTPTAGASRMS